MTMLIHDRASDIATLMHKKGLTPWERLLRGLDTKRSLNALTWTPIAPLLRPRWEGTAFNLSGKVWLVGGFYEDGTIADIEVFDPALGVWSDLGYPFTVFGQAFAASQGLIYAIGGLQACQTLATPVEEYDPATGVVTQKASLPVACYDPGIASVADGRIYVMGGCTPPSGDPGGPPASILQTVQVFDPRTNTWTNTTPMAIPRYQFSAVTAPDGRIYAIGGTDGNVELSRVDVFDPASETWQQLNAAMPTPRRCLASVLASDNKIYAIGGLRDCSSLSTVEVYDPATDTWTTNTPLATGRWYLAAVSLSNTIYAGGGFMRVGDYQAGNPNVTALASVEAGS